MATRWASFGVLAAVCLAAAGSVAGQDEPRRVPPDLAEVLTGAQGELRQGRPADAVRRLLAYRGADHAIRHLLLGHARWQQSQLEAAADAYRTAVRMDPGLMEAGLGLAQVLARQEKWAEAAALFGRYVSAETCEADTLLLYGQVARRLRDDRLCGLLARTGVRRFPADGRLRRLDLAACIDRGDYRPAGRAVEALLTAAPADADLWRQRAFVCDRAGRETDALAALEACLLCDPSDLARHRAFAAGLLGAGDWHTVVRRGRALLAGPMAKAAAGDGELMDLLIRAADAGEQDEVLGAWLARVPDKARTRAVRIVAARRALRLGAPADARGALGRLIEQGQADAGVFLWAGHLAEQASDWPAAETLYGEARKRTPPAGGMATLYLARLLSGRGRRDEAARLLRAYLDAHPADAAARGLLAAVESAAAKPPATSR